MRVYQQLLDMGGASVEQLEGVLGCMIQEAFVTDSRREERTARCARLIELDPSDCDVIIERFERLTGTTARSSGG